MLSNTNSTVFVATPLHDGKVGHLYMAGAMQALQAYPESIRFDVQVGSFLPRNRDVLTARFLESGCTHMLCVDSDIAWKPADLHRLLVSDRWFVSGIYCKKQQDKRLPMMLNGKRDGELHGLVYAPGGFLLLRRECLVAMADRYRHLTYNTPQGRCVGLWSMLPNDGASEDVAFCARWTAMGGDIWAHPGVVLGHQGDQLFTPLTDERGFALMDKADDLSGRPATDTVSSPQHSGIAGSPSV